MAGLHPDNASGPTRPDGANRIRIDRDRLTAAARRELWPRVALPRLVQGECDLLVRDRHLDVAPIEVLDDRSCVLFCHSRELSRPIGRLEATPS
jgi:hypothetical protein